MKKILIVFALLGIVLVSGCIQDTTDNQTETQQTYNTTDTGEIAQLTNHNGECRRDTDCLVAYCEDTATDRHCMDTVQVLTEMKCQDYGGMMSEKNYDVCGCVGGICVAK